MNNNEFNDLENMFGADIPLPDSLSKENMVSMLKEKQEAPTHKTKLFPKLVSVAAAAAIVIVSAYGVRTYNDNLKNLAAETSTGILTEQAPAPHQSEANPQQSSSGTTVDDTKPSDAVTQAANPSSIAYAPIDIGIKAQPLSKFSSDAEMKAYFAKLHEQDVKTTVAAGNTKDYDAISDGVPAAPTESAPQGTYNKTNIQVDGVDEADIVKNDGRYLYIISHCSTLTIVDTQTMQTVFTKEIAAKDDKTEICIEEMYIINSKLVLIGREYDIIDNDYKIPNYGAELCDCYYLPITNSVNILLDISDKSDIKEIKRVTQSGDIVSTRMIGSVLYTVTRYAADLSDKNKLDEKSVPTVNGEKLTHDDIYRNPAKEDLQQYIVISAWDTAKENDPIGKLAILGNGDEVYCSGDQLYVLESRYDTQYDYAKHHATGSEYTEIYSFSLNGTSIAYIASGAVPGLIDNQYSIDKHNAYLRVAATEFDHNTLINTSSLYVLDPDLNVIGKLENIANNEQIKSSRFMGDVAYIVTFRNTDPLFTIDLSDPGNPKIMGQVKLPGFSEYLHPIGNDLLVGVGHSGDDNSADWSTVKISLFDVSDKTNPIELDSRVITDADTDVNYDAKAFLFYPEKNLVGIPLYNQTYDSNGLWKGCSYQFKFLQIENGKFVEATNFFHSSTTNDGTVFFRGSYIGDKLYTMTDKSVVEHSITSGQALRSVSIVK